MTSTEADNKPEHGETAIPGFGKLNEAKASRRLSHVLFRVLELIDCYDLRLPMAVYSLGLCSAQAWQPTSGISG